MASQELQLIKEERRLFSSLVNNVVMTQIQATHKLHSHSIDVGPLLDVVEDILQRYNPTVVIAQQAQVEIMEEKTNHSSSIPTPEALPTIKRIACEITCKFSDGGDVNAKMLALFNSLSNYSWDAKLVLILCAFAVSYGELCLTVQQASVNALAKSVALLKQLPDIQEDMDTLKPRFNALNTLTKKMLDVTKDIIELKELRTTYNTMETTRKTMDMTDIPNAVYLTIQIIVNCASLITDFICLGHEHISSTTTEGKDLDDKFNKIHGLMKQLDSCREHIGKKKNMEGIQVLNRLFEMKHSDNMKILKALIHSEDVILRYGGIEKRVSMEVLKKKTVILFISDLDISRVECEVLTEIYNRTSDRQYEVVWLPVIDGLAELPVEKEKQFKDLVSLMPWHSVHHPSVLKPAVIRFIKEVWNFEKKPLMVTLDSRGNVVCRDALHLMWIWGSLAFPFTDSKEEALWKKQTWTVEFLVEQIDTGILQWAREGRYTCFYGGEDMDWIKQFIAAMKSVKTETQKPIKMVYVGKRNSKELRLKEIINEIKKVDQSGTCFDIKKIWLFWNRLESMWHSMMQHGRTIEKDNIMQEVMTMLTYDGNDHGWAVISKGSTEMVKSHGKTILECLNKIGTWKEKINLEGFNSALKNELALYHTTKHCVSLQLPWTIGKIIEKVVCAECKRPMEKYILYRCCTD
ncbi:protein SIEVE ELEMENT OCCLUSION B-like [Magnolia sinica]|uniref:protein SIEVE ELEMENT OCCLUSION B-like n=1 Tax=Magnolia sinica TaxID=86752 RepID=UPI0026582C2F|nr:protein SIEVE ELEMENT OCCLUSION B-like [Magnolia sinica]